MDGASLQKVLFVCVGNICRSPMAAALLSARLPDRFKGNRVASAGIAALSDQPADPTALALLAERGLDLSAHRARQLTAGLAASFDVILVMEQRHHRAAEQLFPAGRGRIHRLGKFGNFDIPDPYRKPREAFEDSLALIERGIEDFVRAFWSSK